MSEIKVDNLTGKTTANDITVTVGATATMSLEQGLAKAWLNLDGTGTIAARDSFNTTSLVDNSTGNYSYSFFNPFGNSNHTSSGVINSAFTTQKSRVLALVDTLSTTGNRMNCSVSTNASGQDCEAIQIVTHGDLA